MPQPIRHRRHLLSLAAACVALPALHLGARAQSGARLRPTPAQTEGPVLSADAAGRPRR